MLALTTDTWTALGTIGTLAGVAVPVAIYLLERRRRAGREHPAGSSTTARDAQAAASAAADPAAGPTTGAPSQHGPPPPSTPPVPAPMSVEMSWGWPTYDDGTIGEECFMVKVVNRTDRPVRWDSAAIVLADGRSAPFINHFLAPGMGLPMWVQPQTNECTLLMVQALRNAGVDLTEPLRCDVAMTTGERLSSRTWTPEAAKAA